MGTALVMPERGAPLDAKTIESVLLGGDLSKLQPGERLSYYRAVCDSVGLNPLTRPFDYLTLNNKLVLYAKRDATDQLRNIHDVSILISNREMVGECYVVTSRATMPTGRTDESTGVVFIGTKKGDDLANAYMKAETKSKRRVTLSICGLGMLDESEIGEVDEEDPPTAQERPVVQSPMRKSAQSESPSPRPAGADLPNGADKITGVEKKATQGDPPKHYYVVTTLRGKRASTWSSTLAAACEEAKTTDKLIEMATEEIAGYALPRLVKLSAFAQVEA